MNMLRCTGPPAADLSRIEGIFVFAVIWSVGATGDTDGRTAFDGFFRTLLAGGALEKDLQELVPVVRTWLFSSCIGDDHAGAGACGKDVAFLMLHRRSPCRSWRLWSGNGFWHLN